LFRGDIKVASIQLQEFFNMKYTYLASLAALSALFVSCATKSGGEDYDVSNPYSAPDYGDDSGSPYQATDVNLAYDAPAVYEDTAPATISPAAPRLTPSSPVAITQVHTVVRGDSLWAMSRKYGVSVDAIKKANGMTKDTVVLGTKLQIPAQ